MNNSEIILKILAAVYPDAKCDLNYNNPFELLIATILSAQTTDKKVNEVTRELFTDYPTPHKMLELSGPELENWIKTIGLYRTKAKNILETCRIIVNDYQGEIPQDLDKLIQMPGVGRKTASVLLANAFKIPAFPVDTHVFRVAKRLGLSSGTDPFKVEKDLRALIPSEHWIDTHHRLIYHGRRRCSARKPECVNCPLESYCPTHASLNS